MRLLGARLDQGTTFTQALGLKFALRFAAMGGLLLTIYALPFELFGARQDWLQGYLAAYAHLAGGLLALFDHGVVTEGTVIYGSYSLQIVKNCDAADINIVFTSALLALPGALLRKLPLLLAGIAALVVANVGRICSLYFIGAHAPAWFKLAHEEVWPLLLVALTVCVFLGCVHRLQQESPAAEATAAAGEAR